MWTILPLHYHHAAAQHDHDVLVLIPGCLHCARGLCHLRAAENGHHGTVSVAKQLTTARVTVMFPWSASVPQLSEDCKHKSK